MDYQEKVVIYEKAKKILASDLDWNIKFDLIFSSDISGKVDFKWLDLDMDYEDDVRAYMEGFDNYMNEQSSINEVIGEVSDDKYVQLWRNDRGELFVKCKNVSIEELKNAQEKFLLEENLKP